MAEGMETKNFLLENETTKGRHHTFKKSRPKYELFFDISPKSFHKNAIREKNSQSIFDVVLF